MGPRRPPAIPGSFGGFLAAHCTLGWALTTAGGHGAFSIHHFLISVYCHAFQASLSAPHCSRILQISPPIFLSCLPYFPRPWMRSQGAPALLRCWEFITSQGIPSASLRCHPCFPGRDAQGMLKIGPKDSGIWEILVPFCVGIEDYSFLLLLFYF